MARDNERARSDTQRSAGRVVRLSLLPGARITLYTPEASGISWEERARELIAEIRPGRPRRKLEQLLTEHLALEDELRASRGRNPTPRTGRPRKLPPGIGRLYIRAMDHRGSVEVIDELGTWRIARCPRKPAEIVRAIARRYGAATATVIAQLQKERAAITVKSTGGLFKPDVIRDVKKRMSIPQRYLEGN